VPPPPITITPFFLLSAFAHKPIDFIFHMVFFLLLLLLLVFFAAAPSLCIMSFFTCSAGAVVVVVLAVRRAETVGWCHLHQITFCYNSFHSHPLLFVESFIFAVAVARAGNSESLHDGAVVRCHAQPQQIVGR
jgi:hypothetical protein